MRSFLVYSLVLFTGLSLSYLFFQNHFSGVDQYKSQVALLSKELKLERTKSYALAFETDRARQELATLLPGKIRSTESYEIRRLASVLQNQTTIEIKSPAQLMAEGKGYFNSSDFPRAITTFRNLVERFPESVETVEAYFLMAEAYYQTKSTEDAVDTIESLITLFPESELTAFAMLRLAVIFVERQMEDDAIQVVQTVKANFGFHQELREQADRLLVELKR